MKRQEALRRDFRGLPYPLELLMILGPLGGFYGCYTKDPGDALTPRGMSRLKESPLCLIIRPAQSANNQNL